METSGKHGSLADENVTRIFIRAIPVAEQNCRRAEIRELGGVQGLRERRIREPDALRAVAIADVERVGLRQLEILRAVDHEVAVTALPRDEGEVRDGQRRRAGAVQALTGDVRGVVLVRAGLLRGRDRRGADKAEECRVYHNGRKHRHEHYGVDNRAVGR